MHSYYFNDWIPILEIRKFKSDTCYFLTFLYPLQAGTWLQRTQSEISWIAFMCILGLNVIIISGSGTEISTLNRIFTISCFKFAHRLRACFLLSFFNPFINWRLSQRVYYLNLTNLTTNWQNLFKSKQTNDVQKLATEESWTIKTLVIFRSKSIIYNLTLKYRPFNLEIWLMRSNWK